MRLPIYHRLSIVGAVVALVGLVGYGCRLRYGFDAESLTLLHSSLPNWPLDVAALVLGGALTCSPLLTLSVITQPRVALRNLRERIRRDKMAAAAAAAAPPQDPPSPDDLAHTKLYDLIDEQRQVSRITLVLVGLGAISGILIAVQINQTQTTVQAAERDNVRFNMNVIISTLNTEPTDSRARPIYANSLNWLLAREDYLHGAWMPICKILKRITSVSSPEQLLQAAHEELMNCVATEGLPIPIRRDQLEARLQTPDDDSAPVYLTLLALLATRDAERRSNADRKVRSALAGLALCELADARHDDASRWQLELLSNAIKGVCLVLLSDNHAEYKLLVQSTDGTDQLPTTALSVSGKPLDRIALLHRASLLYGEPDEWSTVASTYARRRIANNYVDVRCRLLSVLVDSSSNRPLTAVTAAHRWAESEWFWPPLTEGPASAIPTRIRGLVQLLDPEHIGTGSAEVHMTEAELFCTFGRMIDGLQRTVGETTPGWLDAMANAMGGLAGIERAANEAWLSARRMWGKRALRMRNGRVAWLFRDTSESQKESNE